MIQTDSKVRHSTVGNVVSDKRDKTVTVEVRRQFRHPIYGKYVARSSKFHVHDAKNECKVGDKVRIAPGRPKSKTKSWYLVDIIAKEED